MTRREFRRHTVLLPLTLLSALSMLVVVAVPWPGATSPRPTSYDRTPSVLQASLAPVAVSGPAEAPGPAVFAQRSRCEAALAGTSETLVQAGAEALVTLDGAELRAGLRALMESLPGSRRESARRAAATGLARLGDEAGIRELLRLSRDGHDRYLAVLALAEIPGPEPRRRLAELIFGENEVLRGAAIRAAAQRRDPGYESALEDGLVSHVWHIQEAAASAARDAPVPCLAEVLAVLLRDEREETRIAAAGALSRFDDPRGVAALRETVLCGGAAARFEAARLLLRAGYSDALAGFEHAFRILAGERRQMALSRLERSCPPAAADMLARLVEGPDTDESWRAALVLAGLGDARCLPVLQDGAEAGPELQRAEALLALSRYLRARGL